MDAFQPALQILDVFERSKVLFKGSDIEPELLEINGEISQNGIWRDGFERIDSVGMPKGRLDVEDLLIEFAYLLLQDRVVVFQPLFAQARTTLESLTTDKAKLAAQIDAQQLLLADYRTRLGPLVQLAEAPDFASSGRGFAKTVDLYVIDFYGYF